MLPCWQLICVALASGRWSRGPAALLAAQTHVTGLQEVSVGASDGGRPTGDAVCRAGSAAGGHRCISCRPEAMCIYEMWSGATQEPACRPPSLCGLALCRAQQRGQQVLHSCKLWMCSLLPCLWGQSFMSCAAAAGCRSQSSPQERTSNQLLLKRCLGQLSAGNVREPCWSSCTLRTLPCPVPPCSFRGPTATPNVAWIGLCLPTTSCTCTQGSQAGC